MTLQDQIQLLREENSKQSEEIIGNTKDTEQGVTGLRKTMKDVLDEIRSSRLDNEEQRRDNQSEGSAPTATPVPTRTPQVESGMLDFLIGLPTALLGFATGLAQGWLGAIKDTTKVLAKSIKGAFKLIFGGITRALKVLVMPFTELGKGIKDILSETKWVQSIKSGITNAMKTISNFSVNVFKSIGAIINGAVDNVKIGLKLFASGLADKFKPLTNFFSDISKSFKSGVTSAVKVGASIKSAFETFYINYLLFGDKVKAFLKPVGTTINSVIDAFKTAGNSFSSIGKLTSSVGSTFSKILAPMKKVVDYMRSTAPGIFKAFGAIGKIFGYPLTIAMGLYEGIMNSLDSFRSGDIIGGVFKFVTGAVNGAILSVVDLIKDGISWLAGKLGFENFSGFLDSFSFQELFTEFMDNALAFVRAIPEKITQLVTGIQDWWSGLMDSEDPISYLMDPINQLITDIKDFVMGLIPDISGLVGQGIDAVSDFFGLSDKPEVPKPSQEDVVNGDVPVVKTPAKVEAKEPPPPTSIEVAQRRVIDAERGYKAKPTPARKQILEKRMATLTKLERRIEKVVPVVSIEKTDTRTNTIERPATSLRTENGRQAQEQSKENAQMKSQATSAPITVVAPNSNVTNNNSQTAAVIDNNMPTVDYNDRSYDW